MASPATTTSTSTGPSGRRQDRIPIAEEGDRGQAPPRTAVVFGLWPLEGAYTTWYWTQTVEKAWQSARNGSAGASSRRRDKSQPFTYTSTDVAWTKALVPSEGAALSLSTTTPEPRSAGEVRKDDHYKWTALSNTTLGMRSEERRVGKECRSRW